MAPRATAWRLTSLIDDHAHPFDLERGPFDPARVSLDLAEARRPANERASPSLWREVLHTRLAGYLDVPTAEVTDARQLAASDYRTYVRGLFADAGIDQILMDPAWPSGSEALLGQFTDVSGCAVHSIFRLDTLVDELLAERSGFDELVDRFDAALGRAKQDGHRAFKTVIAYRTGLAVDVHGDESAARRAYPGEGPMPRRAKPVRDFLFRRALRFAADTGLPCQVHTGFGDSDIKLADSNPLLLENLLRTAEGSAATIVLLHGSYPYHEEAAYLAMVRRNVYVDLSLVGIFAPALLADRILRLVELAPPDKILFGTDGYALPETYWLAATLLREAWERVQSRCSELGASPTWVEEAGAAMFEGNARRLYGLS